MTWRESFGVLRAPEFGWFFWSRVVNMAGGVMAPIALAFAVLDIDHSASALGQVLAARSIPLVVFLLVGGVIADRFSRTAVLQWSNLLSAVTQGAAATLVISGQAELWHLIVLEAINGTVNAASFPAMQGLIPQLVPRERLKEANLLLSMSRSVLAIAGPSVAAVLVVTVGPGWALAVDASTWALAALFLLRVRLPAAGPREPSAGMIAELREGWTFFRGTQWLWVVVLAFGVLNAIQTGALSTLAPALAKETFGVKGYGYAVSAEAVGMLLMSLVLLRTNLKRPLFVGMLTATALALPMLVLGAHPAVVPFCLTMALAGAGIEVFGLAWTLAMMEHVDERMQSRAWSYDSLGSFVAIPAGQLLYGPLGDWLGFREVLLASGAAYVVVALLALLSRDVRTLGRVSTTSQPAS